MKQNKNIIQPEESKHNKPRKFSKRAVATAALALAGVGVGIAATEQAPKAAPSRSEAVKNLDTTQLEASALAARSKIIVQMEALDSQPQSKVVSINETFIPDEPASYLLQGFPVADGKLEFTAPLQGNQPTSSIEINPVASTVVFRSAASEQMIAGQDADYDSQASLAITYAVPKNSLLIKTILGDGAAQTIDDVDAALSNATLLEVDATNDTSLVAGANSQSRDSTVGLYFDKGNVYSGANSKLGYVNDKAPARYVPDARVHEITSPLQQADAILQASDLLAQVSSQLGNYTEQARY